MISKLKFWFWLWRVKGYPIVPKWYKNMSILWSAREQRLQKNIGMLHAGIGDILVTEEEFAAPLLSGEGQVIMFEDGSSIRIPYEDSVPEGGIEMYPKEVP